MKSLPERLGTPIDPPMGQGRIRVLAPEVVDQIAAGEVVERPASVIKELVENALDAAATEIRVLASGGGTALLEVTDNGVGMDLHDAKMAVQRHATSKIRTLQDLESLTSLGFRGEALSSIASVSRLELLTRTRDSLEGARVVVEAGKVVEVSPWGCPPGTTVRVEGLFFNVPARRKFLRSETTEARHLKETIECTAMVESGVGFQYVYDGRALLNYAVTDRWDERVRQILGQEVFERLFPSHLVTEGLAIEALLSHPNFLRSSASWVRLYVNGRIIQDRGLLHALLRGYGPLMEKGRYPAGVLQIKLHPKDVDVNVHPTKREVRFQQPERVYEGVVAVVRRLLREQPWVPALGQGESPLGTRHEPSFQPGSIGETVQPFHRGRGRLSQHPAHLPEALPSLGGDAAWERGIRFLGQVGGTYLVFSGPDGLLIVDQHAAHERILFERLQGRWGTGGQSEGQGLLWPEVIDLTEEQAEVLGRLQGILSSVGWAIESFGGATWRIRTVPPWMDPAEASGILRDLLDNCGDIGAEQVGDDMIHGVLAQLACWGAERGGRRLEEPQAMALLEQMRQTPAMGLCPHGRPTVLEIPLAELRRRFERT